VLPRPLGGFKEPTSKEGRDPPLLFPQGRGEEGEGRRYGKGRGG